MTKNLSTLNRRSFLKRTAAGAGALAAPALISSKALASSGELNFVGWAGYPALAEKVFPAFTAATGIKVNFKELPDQDTMFAEGKVALEAGGIDLIEPTIDRVGAWDTNGLLGAFDESKLAMDNYLPGLADGAAGERSRPGGALKYVQVRYAGFEVIPDNELNGITFAGVGRGTSVEYIQVHNNLDDGVEFFGGTVDAKYVVLTGNRDDSLDWADGWTGRMQHVLVRHNPNDTKANRGIEADNQSSNFSATPVSKPKISNMTILGNNYKSADADSEGILLRAGSAGEIYNSIVKGPAGMGECLEIETTQSQAFAAAGSLVMTHSVIGCSEPFKGSVSPTVTLKQWFEAQTGNKTAADQAAVLNGIFTIDTTTPKDMSTVNSFFSKPTTVGAVDAASDWTKGWTVGLGQ